MLLHDRSIVCTLTAMSLFTSAFAQQPAPRPAREWEKVCEATKQVQLPKTDAPNQAERTALANCDSETLYYGFDRKPDPVAARKCAYLEMEQPRPSMDVKVFGREAMLMMIYANGDGVQRNFDVAIKLACELDNASWGETHDRVERLQKYKTETWKGNDFDLCQDGMSGFMQGQCAIHVEKFAAIDRKRRLDSIVARWSEAERAALASLRGTAAVFFKARAGNEKDLSGTGRTAFYESEMTSLEDGFVEKLEQAEQGRLPHFSGSDFAKADTELNAAYADIKKTWEDEVVGSVTVAGIRQTERAWLRYRDAWVAFGAIKYPATNPETWKTLLTRERIKMLREFTM